MNLADTVPSARAALVESLERGLFTGLNLQRQVTTCEVLLEAGAATQSTVRHTFTEPSSYHSDACL